MSVMPTYVGSYEWGGMTGWVAAGTDHEVRIGWASGSPAAGDLALLLYTSDGGSGLTAPGGWTSIIDYESGGRNFEARYRFVTAGDLTAVHLFDQPSNGDFTIWLGIFRGVHTSGTINTWNHAENGGHSSDVAVTTTQPNCLLVSAFCDWAANWAGGNDPGAGATERYYSPNIRWEANMGVATKPLPSAGAGQSAGWSTFGTRNYRAAIALRGAPDAWETYGRLTSLSPVVY